MAAAIVFGPLGGCGAWDLWPVGAAGIAVLAVGVVVIAAWWSTLLSAEWIDDWQPEVAVLGYATREDDQLTVHNIRNFEYRTATDFAPRLRHTNL